MINHEIAPVQHEQLPIDDVLEGIKSWQESLGRPVWFLGHGTSHDRDEDFFEQGLNMYSVDKGLSYDNIFNVASPLTSENIEANRAKLDAWPHLDLERIVLVAAPSPSDRSDLSEIHDTYKSLWMDGLIQKTHDGEKEINHVPSDWILGVYDRNTGTVTMNPYFTGREVTEVDMENSGGDRVARMNWKAVPLDHELPVGLSEGLPIATDFPEQSPDGDIPLIW